jgi:hypothetical protein
MSKNKTRKGPAFGAGFALVATGLAAMPAQAAAGDVDIAPAKGSGLSAFTTDNFTLETDVSALVSATTLSYRIDNPDQHELFIDTEGSSTADLIGLAADGTPTDANALGNDAALANTGIVVDFEELKIVSLLLVDLENVDKDHQLTITVNAWIETKAGASTAGTAAAAADYSIDALYSDSITVTFVDPSSVSVINAVQRLETASNGVAKNVFDHNTSVKAFGTASVSGGATTLDAGATFGGVTLIEGDKILVSDSDKGTGDGSADGIYTVRGGGLTPTATNVGDWSDAGNVLIMQGDNAGKIYSDNNSVQTIVDASIVGDVSLATGPGAIINANTVDGFFLTGGDFVLVDDSDTTDGSTDGIYEVKADGDAPDPINVDDYTDAGVILDADTGAKLGDPDSGTTGPSLFAAGTVQTLVRAFGSADVSAGKTTLVDGASFGGVTLAEGDLVLVDDTDTTDGTTDGLYLVRGAGVAPLAVDVNDWSGEEIYVLQGVSAGNVYQDSGAGFTLNDRTPQATKELLNGASDPSIGFTMKFSNSDINLAQVDLSNWNFKVESSSDDDTQFGDFVAEITPAGLVLGKEDSLGVLSFAAPVSDAVTNEGVTYSIHSRHVGDTVAPILTFKSPGYQVITSPSDAANFVDATMADSTSFSVGTHNSGYPVTARSGSASAEFNVVVESAAGTANEVANVPVLAKVTAGANLPAGESITVSGTNQRLVTAGQVVYVSGLTNADGKYDLTVTVSDATTAKMGYTVQFYALDEDTPDTWKTATGNAGSENAIFNVAYSGAALAAQPDGFATPLTVLSGEEVTVAFTVEDQFGEPISETSKGKAYKVELAAPDTDDLELFASVVDGVATFTFDNYLTAGESDVLSAKLFTGTNTDPSYVSGYTLNPTLYRTNAIAGVNVTEEHTGVEVSYDDFITGKASSTNVAPADLEDDDTTAKSRTITGTVVDANGAGIPGAPVTVAAPNFQFVETGNDNYFVDSITVNADAAGGFSVDFWTHTLSSTGIDVVATSGTATGTTEVKTKLPEGDGSNSVANWNLSWELPEAYVMNTTYAVTATLTDKWGNGISGAELTFSGFAAAEFNSKASETKTTNASGQAVAYLRSVKDVDGLAAIGLELTDYDLGGTDASDLAESDLKAALLDDETTAWDETSWTNPLDQEITFARTAAEAAAANAKVNAGSFKGYVAVYAKGYEGSRLSAKIGNDWVIVDPIVNNQENGSLFRTTDFTGAGVDIAVRIYIDRVLMDTINLTTK